MSAVVARALRIRILHRRKDERDADGARPHRATAFTFDPAAREPMANKKRCSFRGSGESKSPVPLSVPGGVGRRQKGSSFSARLGSPCHGKRLQVERAAVERPYWLATNSSCRCN